MPEVVTIGDATLYCGDCLEILPTLPKVDAVITDPPYGIARVWKGGFGNGWGKAHEDTESRNAWDQEAPRSEDLFTVIAAGRKAIVWGGNYFGLPASRCWLVWNKPERGFSLAEAELAWTNFDAVVRVYDGPRSDVGRQHPTQKPEGLMRWCVEKTTGTVLDPFMGSGTTGVACAQMGRKFIGIEREPRYFDIACKRIEQAHAQGRLFEPASPTQPSQTALL